MRNLRLKACLILFLILFLLAGCKTENQSVAPGHLDNPVLASEEPPAEYQDNNTGSSPGDNFNPPTGDEKVSETEKPAEVKIEITETGVPADSPNKFFYVDKEGKLRQRNITGDIDETIIAGNFMVENYDVHMDAQLIAFVAYIKPGDVKFILYNFKTGDYKIVGDNAIIGIVEWSPNGRYLVLDRGTYIWRSIEIYDVLTDTLTPVKMPIGGYRWSPDGNRLLVGIEELVDPPTPAGEGESSSAAVIDLEGNLDLQIVFQGTTEFWVSPYRWVDKDSVVVRKIHFGENTSKYIKINLSDGTMQETEQLYSLPVPEDMARRAHEVTPDMKYVLYGHDGFIRLWNAETDERLELCEGSLAKWR
ncbi:MAG: WD40 repeat domain-containing protein [Dethiobacter sp.]|jgi:WD40 repeat protein|nr:WD40 repeat domain-containing protein [Dethiobacter sp.]